METYLVQHDASFRSQHSRNSASSAAARSPSSRPGPQPPTVGGRPFEMDPRFPESFAFLSDPGAYGMLNGYGDPSGDHLLTTAPPHQPHMLPGSHHPAMDTEEPDFAGASANVPQETSSPERHSARLRPGSGYPNPIFHVPRKVASAKQRSPTGIERREGSPGGASPAMPIDTIQARDTIDDHTLRLHLDDVLRPKHKKR